MRKSTIIPLGSVFLFLTSISYGQIKMPTIFADNMVLQQNTIACIWGWADVNEKITIELDWDSNSYDVETNSQSRWFCRFKTPAAGGPYKIRIHGINTIVLSNVMIGEVWICSGQSNMDMPMTGWPPKSPIANGPNEIKMADYPHIRLYTVAKKWSEQPQTDCNGSWQLCSANSVQDFSAVGYFFGKEIHTKLKVPVGLICAAWGGTPVEAWTSLDSMQSDPNYTGFLDSWPSRHKAEKEYKRPAVMYNGMIAPLIPYTMRGVIWYQGESNVTRAYQYRTFFPAMIKDWRKHWSQGDFPFLFVQLANHNTSEPEFSWAELRESQSMALSLPATAMVVAIDIGESKRIHPSNKLLVGKRLSLAALENVYHWSIESCGPIFCQSETVGNRIIVNFIHSEGLHAKEGIVSGFEIASNDKIFYKANAVIKYDGVEVWSDSVQTPVAVRYCWANDPTNCSLYNSVELPAAPFRTDSWPGVTRNEN